MTIAHGASDGPILALIAGTHGYEYTSIIALPRVAAALEPEQMHGSVILAKHLGLLIPDRMRDPHGRRGHDAEVIDDAQRAGHAPVSGIWRPVVDQMHSVAKDALVGRILDPFGNVLREIRAPFAGEMLYVVATPPVSEGEPLGMIAAPSQ